MAKLFTESGEFRTVRWLDPGEPQQQTHLMAAQVNRPHAPVPVSHQMK